MAWPTLSLVDAACPSLSLALRAPALPGWGYRSSVRVVWISAGSKAGGLPTDGTDGLSRRRVKGGHGAMSDGASVGASDSPPCSGRNVGARSGESAVIARCTGEPLIQGAARPRPTFNQPQDVCHHAPMGAQSPMTPKEARGEV